jgi:hypothetical protein
MREVFDEGKVEICGINTSKLKVAEKRRDGGIA